jgi:hypothetical protein
MTNPNTPTTKPLGALASVSAGWMLSKGRGAGGAEHRVVQVKDLHTTGDIAPLDELDPVQVPLTAQRSMVKAGDVLLTARGTQMKAALVPEALNGAVATSNLLHIRPEPQLLLPEVLVAFLLGRDGQEMLAARSQGTAIRSLTVSAITEMPVPVPDMGTQRKIAAMWRAASTYRHEAALASDARWRLGVRVVEELFAGRRITVPLTIGSVE